MNSTLQSRLQYQGYDQDLQQSLVGLDMTLESYIYTMCISNIKSCPNNRVMTYMQSCKVPISDWLEYVG